MAPEPSAPAREQSQRDLLCEMLRLFYAKGWVSGTGGGICSAGDGRMLVAPTGVHKERVAPADFFVVDPRSGAVLEPAADPALRPSECTTIFSAIVRGRGAGAVVHSHALSAVLAADHAGHAGLVVKDLEMLKGIRSLNNKDEHLVPVISNTAFERELAGEVERVLAAPRFEPAFAILVRDHGAYIWGSDVWEAKRHTEVYHFLFEAVHERSRG